MNSKHDSVVSQRTQEYPSSIYTHRFLACENPLGIHPWVLLPNLNLLAEIETHFDGGCFHDNVEVHYDADLEVVP